MKQLYRIWGLLWSPSLGARQRSVPTYHSLTATVLVVVLVAQSAYAGSGTAKIETSLLPLSSAREVSQGLGKVAITSGRFTPRLLIDGIDADAELPRQLLSDSLFPNSNNDLKVVGEIIVWLPVLFLLLPGLPFWILVAWLDKPTETTEAEVREVNERRLAARKVITAQGIATQDDFRDRVVTIGRTRTPYALTVLPDRGPSTTVERPDYRPLAREGFQMVLEVTIHELCLFSDVNGKPLLFLCMTVNTRLVRAADNAEIYAKSRAHLSDMRTLTEWVEGPVGFRNELDRSYAEIAEKIADDVFSRIGSE